MIPDLSPRAVLVANAVFERRANSRLARFFGRRFHAIAILGMDLFQRGSDPFNSSLVYPRTFVYARLLNIRRPFHVHDGQHVGGVLADQPEHLFPLVQLSPIR